MNLLFTAIGTKVGNQQGISRDRVMGGNPAREPRKSTPDFQCGQNE